MTRLLVLLLTCVAPLLSMTTAAAQDSKGAITGRITSVETAGPLARARVILAPAGSGREKRASTTDAEGRFTFDRLPAGRYALRASKAGFVSLEYGQRSPREKPRAIVLADGQALSRQDIALPRGAAISGRILDDLGDPVESALVTLNRRRLVDGEYRLVPVTDPVETNDVGEYRIAGLAPGAYYVSAKVIGPWVRELRQAGLAYAPGYYPGVSSLAQARPVVVGLGQDLAAADLTLMAGRPARIAGVLLNARGQPIAGGFCFAIQSAAGASGGVADADHATTKADGSFAIENLSPGDRTVSASYTDPATGQRQSITTRVTLGGADIDGLVLRTSPGVRVSGRIRFESDAELPPPSNVSVAFEPSGALTARSVVSPAWEFEVSAVSPGRRAVRVNGLPEGWAVKEVLVHGRDVTDSGFDVPAFENVAGVDVLVTNRLTEIGGQVTDAQDRPATDCSVLLFAEDEERWGQSRWSAVVRPDDAGHVSVKGLPPGTYFVVALEYLEEGDAKDPEFLQSVRGRATRVTVEDGQAVAVNVKVR